MDKDDVKEKANAAKDLVHEKIKGLAFRRIAEEKIPASARAKYPVLDKLIPMTNYIVTALAALVVVLVVANLGGGNGGGGGRAAPSSDFTYSLTEDGKGVKIDKYTGHGGRVVIPAKIEGMPVVELEMNAFRGINTRTNNPDVGYNITAVVIPASVKKIGSECFGKIEKLTSVTFLGSGVELVNLAFWDCINLANLTIPSGNNVLIPYVHINDFYEVGSPNRESVNTSAFDGCKKLPLAVRSKLVSWGFREP